jgi:hypothetical protein
MPKQRPPFDDNRYEELKAHGLSQRAIAQEMGMPEATLRNNLKVLAQSIGEGLPMGDLGPPRQGSTEVNQGLPEVSHQSTPLGDASIPPSFAPEGLPEEHQGTPPLYVHPGIPDNSEESPVGAEDIAGVYEGMPVLPRTGRQGSDLGPPSEALNPQLAEALTAAWPDLRQMLAWWRTRQGEIQEPPAKLERVTYHIAPRWIEAVRREADHTGDSYAAVVNRALKHYFEARLPRAT